MIFEHMDRIVFAGDSVTDMESAQPVGEGLFENVGKSYVRIVENMLAAFYPEIYLRVTNSGISGNTSRDLLQRFDRDVVSLKPDWVSICIGINDVWRQFDSPAIPDEQVSPEEYRSNVEKMILSEDACIQKPHKGIFDFALKNTNSRRSETLMIGDSWEADIVGAHNSKIDQLWLNPEGLPAKGFTPTYTVRSLEEIKSIL